MIYPLRRQAEIRNEWLKARLKTLLPQIMRREGLDMWIVCAREYNEDPVLMSLLPEPSMSARRRSLLVFAWNESGELECLSLDRYGYPGYYEQVWNPDDEEQAACLQRIVREYTPARIGLNTSQTFSFADGLSTSEHQWLFNALGEFAECVTSAERVCIGWLESRIPAEITAYDGIVARAHELIAEAFSPRVIHPGITTTEEVVWWLREKMLSQGLKAWFHPTVEIQAPGTHIAPAPGMDKTPPRTLIQPGDLLHVDVGFTYLGLTTDHQQHAYLLRPGETDAPQGLKDALAEANLLQDILMAQMQVGRTGNEVLRDALEQAKTEGINPQIYSHPIGFHGHAAGPTIGLWDQQGGVPGQGDYPLFDNTCYSIELNIKKPVPEWDNQTVRIALEEDAVLQNGVMRWLHTRQTRFHLIG